MAGRLHPDMPPQGMGERDRHRSERSRARQRPLAEPVREPKEYDEGEEPTAPGAVTLDAACGSGTTLVAARAEGRRAIGIDADPKSIETTIARLESGSEGDTW